MPTLYVLAGPNGAGKSAYSTVFVPENIEYINPDKMVKQFREENPKAREIDAWKAVTQKINESLKAGKSFAMETTLAGKSVLSKIESARKKGFKIRLAFVSLDRLEQHYERVNARVAQGGHDIPKEDIKRRFKSSYENLPKVLKMVDAASIYNNATERGHICAIKIKGGIIRKVHPEKVPQAVRESLKDFDLTEGKSIPPSPEKKQDKYEIEISREKPFPRRYYKTVEIDSMLPRKEACAFLNEAARKFAVSLGFETRRDIQARVYPAPEKSKEKTRDSGFEM